MRRDCNGTERVPPLHFPGMIWTAIQNLKLAIMSIFLRHRALQLVGVSEWLAARAADWAPLSIDKARPGLRLAVVLGTHPRAT
jgi:hypothetical protein